MKCGLRECAQTNSGQTDSGHTDSSQSDSGSKDAAKGNAAYRNATKRNDTPVAPPLFYHTNNAKRFSFFLAFISTLNFNIICATQETLCQKDYIQLD